MRWSVNMAAAADCSGVCIDAEINGSTPQSDIRPLSGVPGRLPADADKALAFVCMFDKLWCNVCTDELIILKVYFMEEHPKEPQILQWMKEWSQYCGVEFELEPKYIYKSHIRVDFRDGFSYTRIGTDANNHPGEWTMVLNKGKVDRATVLHETGHALGLVHEHQNPNTEPIDWDFPQMLKDLQPQGWTAEDVRRNITNKYEPGGNGDVHATSIDQDSIMLYFLPESWVKPGLDGKKAILFKRNTELSQRDKEFIGKLYPKPSAYPNVTKKPQDQPLNQLPSTTERPRLEYDSGSQAQSFLSGNDTRTLLRLLQPLAADWEHIAPCLNPPLRDGTIRQIKHDNSGKPDQAKHCLREMIVKWLKRTTPCRPSWQNLKAAIMDAEIDNEGIITEIKQHIQRSS